MTFNYDLYLARGLRIMYLISSLLTLGALVMDIFTIPGSVSNTLYINHISVAILVVSLVLFYRGVIKLRFSFGLFSIVILANITISFLMSYQTYDSSSILFFLRDSMVVGLLITLCAFIVNKTFAFFYGVYYICFFVAYTLLTNHPFLRSNIALFTIAFLAYPSIIYYFVNLQDRFMADFDDYNFLIREKTNEIMIRNDELRQHQEEIMSQRDQLELQNTDIARKNKDITENINFAQSIQESILPNESEFANYFLDFFIFLQPKDAISGDFYWIMEKQGLLYIAAVDCTGHGVSGAMVSMIMHSVLNRSLALLEKPSPADILNKIDAMLHSEFTAGKKDINSKIGMDIALIALDFENSRMQYAGAFNPLYMIRNNELTKIEGTRKMIGSLTEDIQRSYLDQTLEMMTGDLYYLFSDGMPDQFGGIGGKKFGYPRLRQSLLKHCHLSMDKQKSALIGEYNEWRGNHPQIDDTLLIGIRI
jgi:serine phosphatase RsbU (regulator of sigma subunit)